MNNCHQVLLIARVVPEPRSSASGGRLVSLMRFLKRAGCSVTLGTAAQASEFGVNLAEIGVDFIEVQLNCSSFDDQLRAVNPDIVLFDRFITEEQFGWRVAEVCPNALRVVDTQDLHFLREARQRQLKNPEQRFSDLLQSDLACREIASILRSDLSLIISTFEQQLLVNDFAVPAARLFYLPLTVSTKDFASFKNCWPKHSDRTGFVFIGNFLHEPNLDAAVYLRHEIWPLIRKALPEAMLFIYGAYVNDKVKRLESIKDGVLVRGRADDAWKVNAEARVALAPLRFGAGQKGKLLDAMLAGTPSVTSEIGAEAMSHGRAWPGAIADMPQEFAEAAVHLCQEEATWHCAQALIDPLIQEGFLEEHFEKALFSIFIEYAKNLVQVRKENFLGKMLMQQTMASTKYLSRWIELKESQKTVKEN
jgi:O-antigen biosynthesis protein